MTAAGKTTSYGYDANGNLTSQTNPNGTTVTQTYSNADELTSLVHKKSDGSTLSQFSYSYNSDGLRSQLNETLGAQTATVTYTYDALHRLKDEVRTGTDAHENHYTFDAAGNRLTWNWGTGSTTYTYDAADRLTQEGNTTYTYNANGSRVSKTTNGSVTSYSYDFDEQLVQVASPVTGTSRFTYDGLGRRVSRTAGGVTTTFHFSGNSITTETQGANAVAHYVYGVNRVSRDASGSFEYYHADGIGSTRQLSNVVQVDREVRKPLGKGCITQNLQFVGAVTPCQPLLGRDMGWQGRAASTDAHDVGRRQILRNVPLGKVVDKN